MLFDASWRVNVWFKGFRDGDAVAACCWLLDKGRENCWMDGCEIWCKYSWPPEDESIMSFYLAPPGVSFFFGVKWLNYYWMDFR